MAFSRSFLDDLGQRVGLSNTFQGIYFEGDMDLGGAYKTKYFFQGLTNTLGLWPICDSRSARATNSNPKLRRCLSLDWGFSISLTSFARPKNLGHPPLGVCQALEKTYSRVYLSVSICSFCTISKYNGPRLKSQQRYTKWHFLKSTNVFV